MFFVNSDTPAVFSYAAVFATADNYLTGNLVMGGGPDPPGMDSTKM